MHDNGVTLQKRVLQNLDIPYSYELAKRMEQYRSHPTLGYRPAGSKAEFETGEMLKTYMEDLGLSNVRKDEIKVDGWEFERAVLAYRDAAGERQEVQLGAYQTDFVTEGKETFQVVYVGKGGEKCALDEIKDLYGFDTAAIVTMEEVVECLYNKECNGKVVIDDTLKSAIDAYYEEYGVK